MDKMQSVISDKGLKPLHILYMGRSGPRNNSPQIARGVTVLTTVTEE